MAPSHKPEINHEYDQNLLEIYNKSKNFELRHLAFNPAGKPTEWRINIVSMGGVAYEFSEQLLRELRGDKTLKEMNIYHRVKRVHGKNGVEEVHPDEGNVKMYNDLVQMMQDEHFPTVDKDLEKLGDPIEYRTLDDLGKMICNTQPNIGDITVIMGRYDFSFEDRSKGQAIGEGRPMDPDDPKDAKVLESLFHNSVYGYGRHGDLKGTIDRLTHDRNTIDSIITQMVNDYGLDPKRGRDLKETILGIRELAKAMRGYDGHVIMATNQIDTTSYVFAKEAHIDPLRVTGFSHVDQTRYTHYFKKKLSSSRSKSVFMPIVGPHNNFITPVKERSYVGKESIMKDKELAELDHSDIKQETVEFGLKLLEKRRTSDKDAPKAFVAHVKSIMLENYSNDRVVRASIPFKNKELYTGIYAELDHGIMKSIFYCK